MGTLPHRATRGKKIDFAGLSFTSRHGCLRHDRLRHRHGCFRRWSAGRYCFRRWSAGRYRCQTNPGRAPLEGSPAHAVAAAARCTQTSVRLKNRADPTTGPNNVHLGPAGRNNVAQRLETPAPKTLARFAENNPGWLTTKG